MKGGLILLCRPLRPRPPHVRQAGGPMLAGLAVRGCVGAVKADLSLLEL